MSRKKIYALIAVLTAAFPWNSSMPVAKRLPHRMLHRPTAAKRGGGDAGQVAFNTHCRTCHSVKPGDNRLVTDAPRDPRRQSAVRVKGFGKLLWPVGR